MHVGTGKQGFICRGLLAGALAILSGCSADDNRESSGREGIQRPNPAAAFCEESGGEYLLESGACRRGDGETVDAWAYYRQQKAS